MIRLVGTFALAAALALAGTGIAAAQGEREIVRADHPGRALFERNCAPCHGTGPGDDGSPTLPGTAALTAKYDGARPGALELRGDLPAPVLQTFVRRGVGAMPGFRPAELSDTEIAAIAGYLTATADANGGSVQR